MKKTLKKILNFSLAAGLALNLLSPSLSAQAEENSMTYGMHEINYTLDPVKKLSGTYLQRMGVIEAITDVTFEGEVVPWVCESFEKIDEHNWQFVLRDNVTFWSGKEVKADEVLSSIDRTRTESPDGESLLEGITFEKIDDYKIKATSTQANQNVPLVLSDVYVMNTEVDYSSPEQTDLTGMYKVTSFEPKKETKLVANENYWGDKPSIEAVDCVEIADHDANFLALQNGEVDLMGNVLPSMVKQIEESDDLEVLNSQPSGTLSIFMNLQHEPFDDKNVRQAFSWALDRPALSIVATEGLAEPTSTWLGTNPKFSDMKNDVYPQQDLAKAEELLAESGWVKNSDGKLEKDGQIMTFKLYTFGNDKLLGEGVQNQLSQLGVEVDLNHVDYTVIEEARETGDWDGLIETWNHYGDNYQIAYQHFGENGSINYGHYQSPEMSQYLEELKEAKSQEASDEIMRKVNTLVAEDAPIISMMPRPTLLGHNKKLKGLEPHFIQHRHVITNKLTIEE